MTDARRREPNADPRETPTLHSRAAFLRMVVGKAPVAAASLALGYSVDWLWARLVRGFRLERAQYPRLVLGRVRVHHNVVGYAAVAAGVFLYPVLLIPLGLGMIVGHGRRERLFWFMERVE